MLDLGNEAHARGTRPSSAWRDKLDGHAIMILLALLVFIQYGWMTC